MQRKPSSGGSAASQLITQRLEELGDWRGDMLKNIRKLVHEAAPDITEDWKWDTPVWTHDGLVCSVGAFKAHVKIHFFKGASLEDPKSLFNAGLDAKTMRAIDLRQGDKINGPALKDLVRAAVALNSGSAKKK